MARNSRTDWSRILAPVLLAIIVVAVWETAVRSGAVSAMFLPAPSDLIARFWLELTQGPLLDHTWQTLIAALMGTVLATLVAVPLGYLIARIDWVDMAVTPYVTASQAIPAVAVAPLLALWIGYGLTPIAILCAVVAFFPMLITTTIGVRALPQDVLEAARLDGANTWQSLAWVEAPLAMPSVLAGIRAGVALSVTGAVVGEFTMGGKGLGMLLTLFRDANDTEGMFATLLMLVILAVGMFTVLRVLESLANRRQRRTSSDMRQQLDAASENDQVMTVPLVDAAPLDR
ncbi:ABC transporter permease [Gulosibacter molinativorax]|uniref:ABC transporter permease n=1 Tax=Gulosibacter molinativorax TaxID=256821 RepID=A0ABT7C7N6_9MICO|nr:ABC transporter permease [Gulosibacter molinativorax]MDJ1371194.1 ABC transporter permease [Gulosibacter molinativorax]QUY63009.1 Putative aliphatic sulfonates transport permease protein SsuC [Gulosibacter molinativorax]